MRWLLLCATEDCSPGSARELVVEDRIVALFNVEGTFYALDGICPHQGGPLGKGFLQGCTVTCPWHGFQFNVTTGQHLTSASLKHETFPVRVDGTQLFVGFPDLA
jgi:nitrite reductase (NADH) small subunit